MTQKSYFYNGISRGDAVEAPYTAELFNLLNDIVITAQRGYIIPDYLNNFYVQPGAGKTIDVLSGAAFVEGVWFESTATENITVADNTTPYTRIDYVVIRIDKTNKTGDIVLVTGVPALVPLDPDLHRTDEVVEVPICKIASVSGFVSVSCTYIYDLREFVKTAYHENSYSPENIMFNGEWIGTADHGALSDAPAMWEYTNTPTISYNDPFDEMARGSRLIVTLGSADTLYTDIVVANDPAVDTPIIIRMLIKVLSGELTIYTDGGLGCTSQHIIETEKVIDLTIRSTFAVGNPLITLIFSNPLATDSVVEIGQIAVSYGYIKPPLQPVHEFILFGSSRDLYSNLILSTQVTGVAYTEFADTMKYAGGYLLTLRVLDSSSATVDSAYSRIQSANNNINALGAAVGRLANNTERFSTGIVYGEYNSNGVGTAGFDIDTVASGAGNGRVYVYWIGAVT